MDALRSEDNFLPDLKELKNDLEYNYQNAPLTLIYSTSSDNESDFSNSSSELKKRDRPE